LIESAFFPQDNVNGKGWPASPQKNAATKKSFASRLTSQLDKLKPRGRDKGAMGAVDRSPSAGWATAVHGDDLAFRERYGQFVVASPSPVTAHKASPFSVRHGSGSKYSPLTRPKRTFRNVMPMRAAAGGGSGRNHGGSSASRYHFHSPLPAAWIAADPIVSPTPTFHPRQHFIHRPHYVDMIDDDYYEGCECFPPSVGRCRRCGGSGRDRIRRVQSEESVTHATAGDAYEVMRRRRQVEGQLCYYDDDDNEDLGGHDSANNNKSGSHSDEPNEDHDLAYAEADYIYSAMNRRPPLPQALPSRAPPAPQRKSPSRDDFKKIHFGQKVFGIIFTLAEQIKYNPKITVNNFFYGTYPILVINVLE
jgi:hypothetical protein